MEININRATPNLIVICADSYKNGCSCGRFYHRYSLEEIRFQSEGELQLQMDRFFDSINFPQASTSSRSFFKRTDARGETLEIMQNTDQLLEHKGNIATFVVHVQYRQNATWQGKIVWADENKEVNFRSALEMIKLMDEVVEKSGDEQ